MPPATPRCLRQSHRHPAGSALFALGLLAPAAAGAEVDPIGAGIGQLLSVSRLLQGGDGFITSPLSQSQFESLASDVSAAVAMPGADAGLPTEVGRWRLSIAGLRAATESPELWQDATGDLRQHLYAPQVMLETGLAPRLGVGVSYGRAPGRDAELYGLRASLLLAGKTDTGGALALRASHNRLHGVDGLEARTTVVDAVGSWGLGRWRPYAGVGAVDGRVSASGDVAYRAETTLLRGFVGLQLDTGPVRFGAELGSSDGRAYQTLRITYPID